MSKHNSMQEDKQIMKHKDASKAKDNNGQTPLHYMAKLGMDVSTHPDADKVKDKRGFTLKRDTMETIKISLGLVKNKVPHVIRGEKIIVQGALDEYPVIDYKKLEKYLNKKFKIIMEPGGRTWNFGPQEIRYESEMRNKPEVIRINKGQHKDLIKDLIKKKVIKNRM